MKTANCLILFLFVSSFAFAQSPAMDIPEAAGKWMQKMNEWLDLSEDKQQKVQDLNEKMLTDAAMALKPLKDNPDASQEMKKEAVQQAMSALQTWDENLQNILSPEEYQQYKAHQKENIAYMQAKVMSMQLELNPEQEEQIAAINHQMLKKMPSRGELSGMNRREKFRMAKKMQQLQQEKEARYEEVLTEEQMQAYLETKADRRQQLRERRNR